MRRIMKARFVLMTVSMPVIMLVWMFLSMTFVLMFAAMAMAASLVLMMIVPSMFVLVLMFGRAPFMRMSAPVLMIIATLMCFGF
jgi:hypothetical protein